MTSVLDSILAKEPERRTTEFCSDASIRQQLAEAQYELDQARTRADRLRGVDQARSEDARREIADLDAKVEELLEQAGQHLIRFTFEAIDPEVFDELKGEHRPTQNQLQEARKAKESQPEWNQDTFQPALVAATCVKVETPGGAAAGLSLEEAQAIWSSKAYNTAERGELFNTALGACLTRLRIDLPKGG